MIQVTDEMVAAASEVVPSLAPETVRRMLEAAMLGQLVFADGDGQMEVPGIPGKTQYPLYLQIQIKNPHRALQYAQTLLSAGANQLATCESDVPIILLMAGNGEFSN